MQLKCGRYRHYKGRDYQVLGQVKHSETEQNLVLYKPLYVESKNAENTDNENTGLWVRPLEMFLEKVEVGGERLPRFDFIEEVSSPFDP